MKLGRFAGCRKAALFAVVLLLLALCSGAVWADKGVNSNPLAAQDVRVLADVSPVVNISGARYQTGGIALRNLAMGAITISGIPAGSTMKGAALYWAFTSLDQPVAGVHNKIQIRRLRPLPMGGNVTVTGTLVGSGADPCWGGGSIWIYRANVTSVVTGAGEYLVTLMPGATGSTAGEDPWGGVVSPPFAEGASLVAIYRNDTEAMGNVLLYDAGLAGATFSGSLSYNLLSPVTGTAVRWDMAGEDGQIGGSVAAHPGTAFETGFLNATQVYGPGSTIGDSFWNGADGNPLPQLHDTHGIAISEPIGPATPIAVTHNAPNDCLTPTFNVLLVMPSSY